MKKQRFLTGRRTGRMGFDGSFGEDGEFGRGDELEGHSGTGRAILQTMKMIKMLLFAMVIALQVSVLANGTGDEILGVWHTTDDKSQVEIFKVKNQYFAKIISLKEPNWPANDALGGAGKPKNDRRNPNVDLRNRPVVGMQIMSDFVYGGKNLWEDGKIYDPESGKTYKCKMTLISTNKLEVRGFVGFSLLGRTVVWTR